ncbi:hypothetical protein ABMA57_07555 [Saccharospirillum sp. HFRX-1]|uniref:hypothetical protein n=1 Tax=unclassified Saccharospirillum TaxID=2633430 RepID=UPI003719DFD0
MKPNTITLEVGQSQNIGGKLRRLKLIDADGPVLIRTPTEIAPLELGETLTLESASDRTEIINQHTANNTLRLLVISSGEGDISSPSSSVAINNQPSVKVLPASSFPGLAPVEFDGSPQVMPGNPDRKELLVVAAEENQGRVWIGSTDGTTGIPLKPEGTFTTDVVGDIQVFGMSGDKLYLAEKV